VLTLFFTLLLLLFIIIQGIFILNQFVFTSGKIFTMDLLIDQVRIWRSQGLVTAMTNGCFDLVHAGHILSLESARSCGHKLIVAINSDESVRRLKGNDRPLNREADRARVIAALACVDAVIVFNDDTAIELLRALRPNKYIKGGDYQPENLPEWQVTRECGIEVEFIPLLSGYSTTNIISSVKE
jgi:D-beta-D-heptose 7-phosphate kinase/D-beta-D-heptose 1-phosphate adenosyltransferase